MKCGVKFCGGCNPRYDRGAAYREIKDELNHIENIKSKLKAITED